MALSATANAALLGFANISPRFVRIRLKGSVANISVVAVDAPILDAADTAKDDFYADLQDVPTSDILVVAGDWNARTGPTDDSTRQILGDSLLVPVVPDQYCGQGLRLVAPVALSSSPRYPHTP